METDPYSLDSDEGIELPIAEHGEIFSDDLASVEENDEFVELIAKIVYLLLPKNVHVSRAARVQWLLDHLNTIVTLPPNPEKLNLFSNEIEIVSIIPKLQSQQSLTKCNRFLINHQTELKFLAHTYRFVYCIDMSPSQSTVDIEKGEILFDEILTCFRNSLQGLVKQFTIPGNSLIIQPSIYLTVIVNTPFFMSPAQQVLVKGVQIKIDNLEEIINFVKKQFHLLEGKLADVAAKVYDQNEIQSIIQNEQIFESIDLPDNENNQINNIKIPMVSPDANFVNMLRYSMLAISLLPENSLSHILVITDGVVAMPDSNIMESLLFQLHYDGIAVSFLKVGSSFHPHSSAGYVSYTDLLYFFSHSTLGNYLETFPDINSSNSSIPTNIYQELFLLWSFHTCNKYEFNKIFDVNKWIYPTNDTFCRNRIPPLLSKRQTDENSNASILLLLSRRMREGFTIDNINYVNGILEIKLCLEWKSYIYIHYKLSSQWPIIKNNTHYEVLISAPYEFLHDITCMIKKDTKSLYRQAIIERFWMRLSQISSNDSNFAQQLSSLQTSNVWYTLPETVRSGIPVFILNTFNSEQHKLSLSTSVTLSKFVNTWQLICQMETNSWRKWYHTHKISLILKHDHPLPKYLHLPNSSHRYQGIQCRQATTALYGMLSEWASFILIDNHTYLKFLYKDLDKPPNWFCIVRITSKLPCAVINMGFVTNTPGNIRRQVCDELKAELVCLSYMPSPGKSNKENNCCILLQKPLEKILIRYERVPNDFNTVIFPDGTQPPHSKSSSPSPLTGNLFTTLSRYLYHKRWIWSATHYSNLKLTDNAISRILNALTRMRMNEGFSFAYSSSGIITMVLEVWMTPYSSCIIQYVLFPPHKPWLNDVISYSDDENDLSTETDNKLEIVTEVWIEPQFGKVKTNNKQISYLDNKYYYEIANSIREIDKQCINSLLTMEHLNLMCQEKRVSSNVWKNNKINNNTTINNDNDSCDAYPITSPRIEHIPFNFDPIKILSSSHQIELLFSMFTEREHKSDKSNISLLDNIHEHLTILHDQELDISKEESDRFTQQIILRHKNNLTHHCPIIECYKDNEELSSGPLWRCFVKRLSITHIILTFVPFTLNSLKNLVQNNNIISNKIVNNSTELKFLLNEKNDENSSSKCSNCSDVPINVSNSLCLPIYVFDCSLTMLIDTYIKNCDDNKINNNCYKDIFEDHRFKSIGFISDNNYLNYKLKNYETNNSSPESKSEESDIIEEKNCLKHCRTLVLVHKKCFTISLFLALHNEIYVHSSDVQSVMELCEENITEIDITEYILTVCDHIKHDNDKNDKIIKVEQLREAAACNKLKFFHNLIKENFFDVVTLAFNPIPTNTEYYYYRNNNNNNNNSGNNNNNKIDDDDVDENNKFIIINHNNNSDEEISNPPSDIAELKSVKDSSIHSEDYHNIMQRSESIFSNDLNIADINPLFLHFICTLRYNFDGITNTSVRVLPTCLGELIQTLDMSLELNKKSLQITLDILHLTLPSEVQNVLINFNLLQQQQKHQQQQQQQTLKDSSFYSEHFQQTNIINNSENSSEFSENLINLSDHERKSVISLCEEIEWILKDEITTSLLDIQPTTTNILNFVMKHVSHSENHSSCVLDIINLNFVYESNQTYEKFVEEFAKINITNYKLSKKDDLYYLTKDIIEEQTQKDIFHKNDYQIFNELNQINLENDDNVSEISSASESVLDTDKGYEEDVDDNDDCNWLEELSNKRPNLPNFWLIMKIDDKAVTIYFHCRFLNLLSDYYNVYIQVQSEILKLCKKVNQYLLLKSLYETKICSNLLEIDDCLKEWHSDDICTSPTNMSQNQYGQLTSVVDEINEENEHIVSSSITSDASLLYVYGYFSCPVVWETHFILHPRLKTGPGKSGILALKNTLEKFSVHNRTNMFVYCDNKSNVFYLRLHENLQNTICNKPILLKSNEFESTIVSRSPSIASLPLRQTQNNLTQCTPTANNDIRPRVRSFGEKETKDLPNEDTLILKVHGITEAGSDVQFDLAQVLQNRLDDAVLYFLSVMLARNSMCPLTPEDVHFIQKPFRPPEIIIRLTIQDFVLQYLDSFIYYLKQNLLQFLNIPNYPDKKSHYHHFKDYSESEQTLNRNHEDNIFIYNQSQNPSSGSQGIACIALAVVSNSTNDFPKINLLNLFKEIHNMKAYKNIVTTEILEGTNNLPNVYLEFRLWKQGKVNIDNLSTKFREAIGQANWDIIMEYTLLTNPLCEEYLKDNKLKPININERNLDLSKEIEFNCLLDLDPKDNINFDLNGKRKVETLIQPKKRPKRINPLPTTKTTRSITFDDDDDDNNNKEIQSTRNLTSSNTNKTLVIKLNSLETGDDGILSDIYSKYLSMWIEFGSKIKTPSVKKHKILLTNYHLPNIIIKELLDVIQETPKAFYAIPTTCFGISNDSDLIFVSNNYSNLVQKCIIISRNCDHWKTSTVYNGTLDYPEIMSPQALKNTQKFVPSVINNKFIPRQKILWILVECDSITIYTYNWTKDNIDKLITNCTKLGQWLSVRSCFLNSVTSQKLGLFHNQALTHKTFLTSNNPYTNVIGSVNYMSEFPKDYCRKNLTNGPNLPTILETFRDLFHLLKYMSDDPVTSFTYEMHEMKRIEKESRDEMKELHKMYQSRTSTTTVPQIILLMKHSRILHYCHTPLLLLPKWRLKAATTRDHSFYSINDNNNFDDDDDDDDNIWHTKLCYGFFCEYRRYLQTFGFMPLQIDSANKKQGKWSMDSSSYNSIFYIQKTIRGGILLFTVEFNEPFFTTVLHVIECNRLQKITSRASINRFTLSFLDECDRIKILMHLHSFTYDYHLRCIYNYISNMPGVNRVCDKYDVNQFFDDFLKYYNKTPNFARNLIHADTITINNLVTEGAQLYDYLLTNVGQYNFKVMELNKGNGIEYILVQVINNTQVSYKDSHDRQHTDDFEITLIVYNLCTPYKPTDNILHLKYYLILTSRKEIYPKSEVEQKLGKFRTVSSTTRILSNATKTNNIIEENENKISKEISNEEINNSLDDHNSVDKETNDIIIKENITNHNTNYSEISQEYVNYLGYYSSHEQLMQQMILDKANTTQNNIKDMVAKGMIHCRIHILWNKLLTSQESTNLLTFDEFIELKDLAKLEHLCDVHPNLGPLLNKPLTWYQGLVKLLLIKYNDQNRSFISTDGNIQHYVILHPEYFGAFMLLSMDLHTSRGDLYAVYREPHKEDADLSKAYRKALLDGFVNCICFYLWYGMV